MKKIISFQIDSDLLTRLDNLAQRGNRSQVLRRMIEEFLNRRAVTPALPLNPTSC